MALGDNAHLSDEQRQMIMDRAKRRGELLAIVTVRVYEPHVSFPPDAVLDVETDQSVISEVVRRARERLGQWR